MEVYLDNSATTRTFPEVAELMTKIMCEDYGNPSSLHMKGVEAEKYLRYAKETLARILKVEERELLFTSGGTESDNMALIGCALANCRRGNHLITTQIEHPAILQTMRYLESQGYRVTYLPVDPCGRIRLEDLRKAMTPETILVSIMHTNNEIGALQPIEEAGALIKQMNPDTLFHVDAVQGFGKSRIYPKRCTSTYCRSVDTRSMDRRVSDFYMWETRSRSNPLYSGADSSRIFVPVRKMYRGLQDWQKQRKCCTVVSMKIMRDFVPARDDLSRA